MMSTVKGKGKARDDDVVSLDFTEDEGLFGEDDTEMEEVHPSLDYDGTNDLGTAEYNVDHEISSSAGLEMFHRQVHSTQSDKTMTNSCLQLDNHIAINNNNNICFSCSHECE